MRDIQNMKTALVIICSFLLAGTPLVRVAGAQAPPACAHPTRACCHHGWTMPCCAAKSSPDSQPAQAPAQTGGQNQLSLLTPGILTWTLPSNPADSISSHSTPSAMTAGAPLYARNCARLI
jgi:hypothetical protein